MKFLILLTLILPIAASAQTNTDYEQAMAKFQKYYNAGKGDSINLMFRHDSNQPDNMKPLWTDESNASLLKKFGTLKSFKYIGIDRLDPQKVHVFETRFSNGEVKTTSMTLDKDHKLGTFRFITSSEGIAELRKKKK